MRHMHYLIHPEIEHIELLDNYRGGIFAMPVLLHPQGVRNSAVGGHESMGVDPLRRLDYEAVGTVLHKSGLLSKDGQNATFLAHAVDASFVSSSRGEAQGGLMKALVTLHQSLPSTDDLLKLFRISGFDPNGGGLVFIFGLVYRHAADLRPIYLPDPNEFLFSRERLDIEIALSGNQPGMYRHQVLAPYPLSTAIAQGVATAVSCHTGMTDQLLSCSIGFTQHGDMKMELLDDEGAAAVSLNFARDALSTSDINLIHERALRSAAMGAAAAPNYFRH